MEDLGRIKPSAPRRGNARVALGVSGTYAHAVRAWLAAEKTGMEQGAVERLSASLRNLEEAADQAHGPARAHLLDAARLIRTGDLIGAKAAFEMAVPVTAGRVPTSVAPAPRAGRWLVREVTSDAAVLGAYLGALAIAELAVTFVNPLLVFPLHGGIIGVAAVQIATLGGHPERERRVDPLASFLLAFLLAALIRIISLTLPLASIDPAYQFLFAAVPMTLGALLVGRASSYSLHDVGLARRVDWLQAAVILISVALGFVEFAILRSDAMGAFPWTAAGILPALAVGISTGFPEELIFRGIMQTATRPLLGRWNWIYVSAVFAVLHIGYQSVLDLTFVFGVGLFYGWVFERTRSIVGVSIGHGLANVVLFFVAPNMPELSRALGS